MRTLEQSLRMHVRNWFCGLTESECYEAIAAEYRSESASYEEITSEYYVLTRNLKVKAMIEWCCEKEFWTSN